MRIWTLIICFMVVDVLMYMAAPSELVHSSRWYLVPGGGVVAYLKSLRELH